MRLEITRKTDLALQVLRVLDGHGDPMKGKALADEIGTTPSFIPQIMKPLVDSHWVSSDRGPTGGYRLSPEASQLSLLALIEAVEGPTLDNTCVLQGSPCPIVDQCAMHSAWTRARSALISELDKTPVLVPNTEERASI